MRFRNRSVHAVTLIGLGLCALAAGQQEPAAPIGTPRLEISSQLWDFGEAWEGEVLEYQVRVKNVGDAPLHILEVETECGCTVPTKPKSPLAPGESDRLGIRLETKGKSGNRSYPVTLVTNDPRRERTVIQVRGQVSYLFEMKPFRSLAFGLLYPDSAESRSVELVSKYPGGVPLKLKENQDFRNYAVELKELEPGQRYKLTATSRPPLKLGLTAGRSVTLLTGLTFIPEIPVGISASVQPLVRVRPNRLFLPTKSVVEMRLTLRVEHAPHYPVTVREVKATHDAIKVELSEALAAGTQINPHRHEVVVLLPPGDRIPPGARPQIEIVTDAKDPAYQKLVVPVQMISPLPRPARPQPGPAGRSAPAAQGLAPTVPGADGVRHSTSGAAPGEQAAGGGGRRRVHHQRPGTPESRGNRYCRPGAVSTKDARTASESGVQDRALAAAVVRADRPRSPQASSPAMCCDQEEPCW